MLFRGSCCFVGLTFLPQCFLYSTFFPFICQSVHHFGPELNIYITAGWVALKFCTHIQGHHWMNPADFSDFLVFPLALPISQSFYLFRAIPQLLNVLDWHHLVSRWCVMKTLWFPVFCVAPPWGLDFLTMEFCIYSWFVEDWMNSLVIHKLLFQDHHGNICFYWNILTNILYGLHWNFYTDIHGPQWWFFTDFVHHLIFHISCFHLFCLQCFFFKDYTVLRRV